MFAERRSAAGPARVRLLAAINVAAPAALMGLWLVFALWRYYRRFVYDTPDGRVWGLADDVYISASFGRTLIQGHGFVWYPGAPRVEGVSNPLWSVVLGVLHWAPGFSADRLGAFVLATNALLLVATAVLFWTSVARASGAVASRPLWLLTVPLVPLTAAVSYWSAEGFEIALLALLACSLLHCAFGTSSVRHGVAMAVLVTVGLATRMDFALLAAPALIIDARRNGWARARFAGLVALALLIPLFCARHAYYGAWLPNTYWLKATGWPLSARLQRGSAQNWALLSIVPAPWLMLVVPPLRRHLVHHCPHALAAWFGFSLTVLYSTYVGGDAWGSMAGYDRHTAVGGLLLVWGCVAFVLSQTPHWGRAACAALVLTALAAWPVLRANLERSVTGITSAEVPTRTLERDWIAYGKAFRDIARPGARIAICPAGAIVYFSERGGVDLLGKVDPFVAHLEVAMHKPKGSVCWRYAPGHNKEDDVRMFGLRKPEFSRYHPPPAFKADYMKVRYKGMMFFARRGTQYLITPRE